MLTTGELLDIAWILVCAALVMLMQAGFSCLESGLVRTKNSINVATKNFADFCLSSVLFWLFGFALMFGDTAGGWIGTSGFLFGETGKPWLMAFFIFQLGFCGTATTIVSGAVAERMRFSGYLVAAAIISAVIYPVIGHWVWGSAAGAETGGWLEQMGFIDFAGSTVVHSVGGWIALAAIIIIGPRSGRFGKNAVPIHGHDLPMVTLGVFLLWFGWFGFNGGSTLGLTPEVPLIIVNTTVSGAFGGLIALALAWRFGGRPDVTMIMNGSLAGLVGITASAHIMTPAAAAAIGSLAAVVMYAAAHLLERFEIDDVVGAVPVHLAAGIWGTLAVAIFGNPEGWGTGLSRWEQLGVQATGIGATFVWAFGVGFALLWLINRVHPLRIDPEGERIGLNVAEHGASTDILDLLTEMDDQRRAGDFSQPVSVEPHTEVGQIAQQYNYVLADINAEQKKREAVTEALRQQTASLQLLRQAASAANRAKSIEDAIRTCLESICAYGGWSIGHCFMADEGAKKLTSTKIWHLDDEERYAAFREITEKTELKAGTGLSSLVLASGEPNWVADLSEDRNFSRAAVAKDIGIKGGAAFPVMVGDDVAAVLEFFSSEPKVPNETISEVMEAVGTQLGRVVEREKSNAARFKSVVDNMPAHVHLRDRDGRFILINRQYEEFYGVTNDAVRGKTLHEISADAKFDISPDENEASDRRLIETDQIIEHEFDVLREGELRTLSDVKFPIKDHSGKIIAVGGIEVDITERKMAAEALRQAQLDTEAAEARLLDAIENISEGFVVYDSDGRLQLCNSKFRGFYNYSEADAAPGTKYEDLVRLDFERGIIADEDGQSKDYIERRIAYRKEKKGSFEVKLADGRWILIQERPTSAGGRVGVQADITELKGAEEALRESETRFAQAARMANLGHWAWDEIEDKCTYCSEDLAQIHGVTVEEYLAAINTVENDLARIHPDDRERYNNITRHWQNRGDSYDLEYRIVRPDGEVRDVREMGQAIRDDAGRMVRSTGTKQDITRQKLAERELAEKEAQLRAALDNMPGGMVLYDRDLKYVLFNSQYSELFDFPDDLVKVGGSRRDVLRYQADRGDFGSDDPDGVIERVIANHLSGEAVSRERTIAGSGRTLQVNVSPTPDGGSVSIYTDITERKRAEQVLAEKEAQLRVALDNMPGGMRFVDEDGKYVFINSRYLELYDFPKGLLKVGDSHRVENLYQAKRGDFGPGDPEVLTDEWIVSLKRGTRQQNWERTTVAGKVLQVSTAPTPDGGFVNIVTDITERKSAEAALQEAHEIIKEQRDRMEDELNIGREIQMSMIPLTFPPFPDHSEFSVFAALEPAREVGGDFYDFYFIDEERLCFCIGDVSGKGVPAALFMAMAKTLIKSRAADDRSTASILTHVNDELSADNETCMFVTIFSGILNIRTGELLYTNAGHNPPYLKRKDGSLQTLDQRHGPVIGAVEGMVYGEDRDTMAPGDLLLLFTDGVTEAMDVEDRLFSEDRLEQLLMSMDTDDVDKVVDSTVDAVRTFEGEAEQADDITVLALAFHGSPEDALIAERRIVIKNHLPEIAVVNEKFEAFAEKFDVPRPLAMKFDIIFDEVLNNIITYAYNDDGDHDIEIRMELAGDRLIVTIADDGAPFNPLSLAVPRTDQTLEDREVGGIGIHLVRNLVDNVSYQRRIDKNVLTLMSHLQQKESAA